MCWIQTKAAVVYTGLACQDFISKVLLFFIFLFFSWLHISVCFKWFGGRVCKSALSGLQLRLKTWGNFMYLLNCIDISESEEINT